MRYELTDDEWAAIEPFLPNKPRGVPRVNDRRVLNGIYWVLRSGAPWRDLPRGFGPYTTCYNRFVRWRRAGVWRRIMEALAAAHDTAIQMIDTSVVRVHQHGACITRNRRQSMGRSRGGLTSKIHAVVDANGLPVRLALTAGEAHDNRLAGTLLSRLKPKTMVLADRGYDADWIRALAADRGAWANIPPRCNRKEPICFSPYLYRARNLVERFFNKIKHCRRVATRYDKLAANYLAFIHLASIRLWLRVNESTSYYLPGDLEASIGRFVDHYNHCRHHESLSNLTPADVYFRRGQTIEKGSNATQSKIVACSIERKPPKLKPDEPVDPVVHTASCRNLSDDGHPSMAAISPQREASSGGCRLFTLGAKL